ncbi:MAG: acetyltransferase [Chitinophagales bacterium]|nr:acetyltransferase [Chitinophagales bacterium]
MIIAGAGGFAKELLEVILQKDEAAVVAFFDDQNDDAPDFIHGNFPVIKNIDGVKKYFSTHGKEFAIGTGKTAARKILFEKLISVGGNPVTIISPHSAIGKFGNEIGSGSCIMTGVIITSDVKTGIGCLFNLHTTIGHDCVIGSFCEFSPGVSLSGKTIVGDKCFFGTGAVTLPGVKIGDGCIIGAGAVVNKDVPAHTTVIGIPAKPIGEK